MEITFIAWASLFAARLAYGAFRRVMAFRARSAVVLSIALMNEKV